MSTSIAIGVGVFFFLGILYVGGKYYINKREKRRRDKESLEMARNNTKKAQADRWVVRGFII